MKITLFGLCFLVLLGSAASSQTDPYGLPAGAQIIEVQPLQSMKHPHRALVLWMQSPLKVPRDNPDDPYTCPEYTRGSHYSGATRVSLVDQQTKKIINTIKILNFQGDDTFDIPYRIESGLYYHVSGVPKGQEGKPTIMWLQRLQRRRPRRGIRPVRCRRLHGTAHYVDRLPRGPRPGDPISRGLDRDFGKPEVHPDCLMGGLSVQQAPGVARLLEICHRLPGESREPGYLRGPLSAASREVHRPIDFHPGRPLIAPGGLPNQAGLTERPGPFRALSMGEPPLPREPSRTQSGGGNRD